MTSISFESLSKQESHDTFGPTVVLEESSSSLTPPSAATAAVQNSQSSHNDGTTTTTTTSAAASTLLHPHSHSHHAPPKDREKLEQENQQLLREVLTCRKNLDIAQQNVSTLKALSNQLAQQLNSANSEVSILREKRTCSELQNSREAELRISALRESYEKRLEEMRRELEEQIDINTQLAMESQDAHRKADKSFKDIIATKDGLIAELTRTVECLQAGMRSNNNNNHHHNQQQSNQHNSMQNNNNNKNVMSRWSRSNNSNYNSNVAAATTLSSPHRAASNRELANNNGSSNISPQDAVAVRNSIIEPTIDLLRLSLRAMRDDVSKRRTPLGDVNSVFYSSDQTPTTRYFVDVQADKHRLDEVPTIELIANNSILSGKHFGPATPTWPKSWKFQTPQGELITLSLDVVSL